MCWRFAHPVNDWKRPRDMPTTMTEEDMIRMTVAFIILAIAQGTDTTVGAWLVGTACLPTQLLKLSAGRTLKEDDHGG